MANTNQFPKDEHGSYVTLEILKQLPNGNTVKIYKICSNVDNANLDQFQERFYFKTIKDVSVIYSHVGSDEQKSILLRNLKQVWKFLVCLCLIFHCKCATL